MSLSWNVFYTILIIIAFILIYVDYKSSKGFIRQKILHALVLIFIFYIYRNAIRDIIYVIANINDYYAKNYVQYGIITPAISLTINLISNILGGALFISAIGLLARSEYYRIIMVHVLPIVIIINIPSLYMGYVIQPSDLYQMVYLIIAFIVFSMFIGIYILYRSKFMTEFFSAKKN